jgi:hypothetical protein
MIKAPLASPSAKSIASLARQEQPNSNKNKKQLKKWPRHMQLLSQKTPHILFFK